MVFGLFKNKKHIDNLNYLHNLKKEGNLQFDFVIPIGLKAYYYKPVLDKNYKLIGYEKSNDVGVIDHYLSKVQSFFEPQYVRSIKYTNGLLSNNHRQILTKSVYAVTSSL